MRLSEIDKATFHRKLADPAAQDLLDRAKHFKRFFDYRVIVDGENEESAIVEFIPPPMHVEMDGGNPVEGFKNLIRGSDHWVWDTWMGDAESGWSAYVIRKT